MHKPRLTTDLDVLLASSPLDATAASVVAEKVPEYNYQAKIPYHWSTPPETLPFPPGALVEKGHKFGRFTVVGYLGSKNGGGAKYLVRCTCGQYECRSKKAALNPANSEDRCHVCRRLLEIQKHHKFLQTERGREWSKANVKPLLSDKT